MSAKPKRRRLRFHLSTVVVMMLAGAGVAYFQSAASDLAIESTGNHWFWSRSKTIQFDKDGRADDPSYYDPTWTCLTLPNFEAWWGWPYVACLKLKYKGLIWFKFATAVDVLSTLAIVGGSGVIVELLTTLAYRRKIGY